MYDTPPFSAADEAAMLELFYASNKTPDGQWIDFFQLSNGNPEPVPQPFKDYLKQIANIMLGHEAYGEKGLNQPDFGSLNLDIQAENKAVNLKLGRKRVKLALVDEDGNIVEDDNRTIYQEVISDGLHRWKHGPFKGRATA